MTHRSKHNAHAQWIAGAVANGDGVPGWAAFSSEAKATYARLDAVRTEARAIQQNITALSREREHVLSGWKKTPDGLDGLRAQQAAEHQLSMAVNAHETAIAALNRVEERASTRWKVQSLLDTQKISDKRSVFIRAWDWVQGYENWHTQHTEASSRYTSAAQRRAQADMVAGGMLAQMRDVEARWAQTQAPSKTRIDKQMAQAIAQLNANRVEQARLEQAWDSLQKKAGQLLRGRTPAKRNGGRSGASSESSAAAVDPWMVGLFDTAQAHRQAEQWSSAAGHARDFGGSGHSTTDSFGGSGYSSSPSHDSSSHSSSSCDSSSSSSSSPSCD